MRDPTLLLPFGLPPAQHAKDLLAALDAPALSLLLARSTEQPRLRFDPFAAALPHEILRYGSGHETSPPLAHQCMQQLGLAPQSGVWFMLQPVHWHVARDHLVLTDPRQLGLDEPASRALFEAVQPLFEELGYTLQFGDARHWFVRADTWHNLRTTTPNAATGHNVEVWLPTGEQAREWRKLHNEVQMLWHNHPLNEAREANGQARVNALWLWGGANPQQALARNPAQILDESLLTHALADDWGRWLMTMQDIERTQIVPLLHQLQNKSIDSLTLQLTDAECVRQWRATPLSLRKFWRKPSLQALLRTV